MKNWLRVVMILSIALVCWMSFSIDPFPNQQAAINNVEAKDATLEEIVWVFPS